MKQKLLTDIELDVHELKYLMDSFSKKPTQTLSELLKRSIQRMQERLEQLSEDIDTVQIEPSDSSVIEESKIPIVESEAEPIIPIVEETVVKDTVYDDVAKEESLESEELIAVQEPQTVVEEVIEDNDEALIEDNDEALIEGNDEPLIEVEEDDEPTEDDESPIIVEPRSSILGESIKLSAGLRQSISLNDSFRFSRELFGGDSETMNRVIEQISVMSSYKTAIAFLSSKVDLSKESESLTDFLELLKKYFNQSA